MPDRIFEYVLTRRPVGVTTTPRGAIGFRKSRDARFPYGVVQYARPLRKEDVEHFDLIPLDPFDPINVRRIIDAWNKEII